MINPDEYNTLLINIRLSLCAYSDKYANLSSYGLQTIVDKLKLILLYRNLKNLEKARINPIDDDNRILPCVGQLTIVNDEGNRIAEKEYNESNILQSIKNINHIIKTGYTLNIYPDVYYDTNPK